MSRRGTRLFLWNFADQLCLKVHCIRNILSHVCTLAVGAFGRNGDLKNVTMATFAITPSNIYDAISWFNFNLETSEWYQMKAYELYFYLIPLYVN